MSDFKQHWDWALTRGTFQQNYVELEHVYNLMNGCKSYLEIGSAEGNSLYILGSAVDGSIDYVDIGEAHTDTLRAQAIINLDKPVSAFIGDSTNPKTYPRDEKRECVLIDGGHDFATVLSDSILYAPLATKYVFWHDIQIPEVKSAVEWFVKRWSLGKYSTFINSNNFGYGILEIK